MALPGEDYPIKEILEKIASYTIHLRDKAKAYGKIFENSYPNLNAFSSISNDMVLVHELLDYYYIKWYKKEQRKKLRRQDVERITHILKLTYIHSFSIVEYITKQLIKEKNCKDFREIQGCLNKGERVSFYGIIERSKTLNLLDDQEKKLWDNLREIRNILVHNNGFSDKDGQLKYRTNSQYFVLNYRKDEPIQGDIILAHRLVDILIELYYKWVEKILLL